MDLPERLDDVVRLVLAPVPTALIAAWGGLGLLAAPFLARRRRPLLVALRVSTTVAALGGACFLLGRGVVEEPEYYKHVDQVLAEGDSLRGKRLLIHGCIVDGSIERDAGDPAKYRFLLAMVPSADRPHQPGRVLRVDYEGLVPDSFVSGAEAVVKGRLTPDGGVAVAPDGIMTKCPSKYVTAPEGGPPLCPY
jgi:cytochrome c-type biogenesis protein CcmE